jgi:AraC-like DNA-binding protein
VIFSRQRWAHGDAVVSRYRALAPSWTIRLCDFRGVLDDERPLPLAIGLGIDEARTRVSVVLEGRIAVVFADRVTVLEAGDAMFAHPIAEVRGFSLGDQGEQVLELDWVAKSAPHGLTSFRAPKRVREAAATVAMSLADPAQGGERAFGEPMTSFVRAIESLGIQAPELGRAPFTVDDGAQRLMSILDDALVRLDENPQNVDLEQRTGSSRWTVNRALRDLLVAHGVFGTARGTHWRSFRDYHRLRIARMLMTQRGATVKSVARRVGYGSVEAMCHAFAHGGLPSPAETRYAIITAC